MSVNPYSPPATAAEPPPGLRRWVTVSLVLLGASVAGAGGAAWIATDDARSIGTTAFIGVLIVSLAAFATGVKALVMASAAPPPRSGWVLASLFATLGGVAMMGLGALGTILTTMSFTRGRQLRRWGRVLLPPLAHQAAWATEMARLDIDPDARRSLAAQWRENARTEHASVAAFARLTLDLVALGAPPALVAAAQRDALDEIAHAKTCFGIARAIDGVAVGPGPFPQAAQSRSVSSVRTLALARLAVDSFVDGALHEGVSARIIAKLARRCEIDALRSALRRIAADEGRHAAHGWDVVEWCVAEGGSPVVDALRGAAMALPATMRSPLPAQAADGDWEKWGIVGHALEGSEYSAARADLRKRVMGLRPAVTTGSLTASG